KKTKTKQISTNSDELQKILDVHPVVPLLLKYRELTKLLDSFLTPLPNFIAKDLRIHTIWNQTGTTSGRLSSESPNLQNIPHYGENGQKIRSCFVSPKGSSIVSFDYSQMELRVAATLSQDKELLDAFLNNKDVHQNTASLIFNIPYDKVSKEERQKAKTFNFGLIYGMGSRALAKQAEITVAEAKEFVTEYFSHYYSLKNYLEELQNFAIENNYCQTEYGRKRYLPFVSYLNQQGSSERRIAINMPIQGLASDLIKISMNNIFDYLKENSLLDKVKFILQIHDELVFEIQNDLIDKVCPEIQKLLEENDKNIPLKVDIKKGSN
ncbi:MAG: DNA polymerase, partial [Candidatus Pacebacteria bacterium]|nr:DNA polymerase [Candidatus Paceibacterota bacterium]